MSATMDERPAFPGAGLTWADVLSCERVVVRFTAAFDANDLDGMLAEFAPDGVWHRQNGVIHGHDGLRAMMGARPSGPFVRHIITNQRVVALAAASAACASYVTVYRHDGGEERPAPLRQPSLVGSYHDVLQATDRGWQLSGRRVSVDFK